MDEIFDRIKAIKIRKKDLFLPLVLTEILGILVLIWFLRVPLSQKYFSDSPSNYSVDSMDSNKQYLFKQADLITGKSEPFAKFQILLSPDGGKYPLSADAVGNITFQIPHEIAPGEYRLLIVKKESGIFKLVKNLKIRIESNNKIAQFVNSLF